MPNIILDLEVDRVDLVDEGANSAAHIKLYKRKEPVSTMLTYDEIIAKMKPEHAKVITEAVNKAKLEVPADTKTALDEAVNKSKDLETKLEAASKQLENAEVAKSKSEPDFEEVMKGLDPSLQEVFKSMKMQKEAAEAVAKQAAEKAIEEEAIAKAKDLKSLPVEEAKLVDVLKGISPEVHEILKAANKAIEDGGLFEEVGKSKGNDTTSTTDDAWSKIEKAADKIVEEQKVTKAKAITEAIKANPELYREYLKGGAN